MLRALQRLGKYSLVGGATFAFDLLLLFVLVDGFAVPPVVAAAAAFLLAVSINYVISRRWVFPGTLRSVHEGYAGFVLIALAGLLIVLGGMYLLTVYFSVNYLLARVTVAAITGFWNYLMNLYVNFKVAGKH